MNTTTLSSTGLHQLIEGAFEVTYERIRTALKAADFEILAEINLADFDTKKSESYGRQCKVMVVCNTDIAHKALIVSPDAAVMLPYNVAVSEAPANQVEIWASDPHIVWNTASNVYLKPIAEELKLRLERILAVLRS